MRRSESTTRLIVGLGTLVCRLWFATCRVRIVGRDLHARYVLGRHPLVGASWHRNAIFMVWFFRRQHPAVMFSRSHDGELLARFAARLGVVPVRGSTSRGGHTALRAMLRHLRRPGGGKVATVVDGPRGPRGVAKSGMIVLAKMAGAPLLPVMMSAHPAITLSRTWDRTLIPLPFSRVTVSYAPPWIVPPDLDAEGMERLRAEVEATLNRMMREADAGSGYRERVTGRSQSFPLPHPYPPRP